MNTKTKPRRVNPFQHRSDLTAAVLGELGFSRQLIARDTGLTKHQVGYRLNKFGIRLADYRNGNGIGARRVVRIARQEMPGPVERMLRDKLGPIR